MRVETTFINKSLKDDGPSQIHVIIKNPNKKVLKLVKKIQQAVYNTQLTKMTKKVEHTILEQIDTSCSYTIDEIGDRYEEDT